MDVKIGQTQIAYGARSDDGTKLEPEEQTVKTIQIGTAPVSLRDGRAVGSIPIEITGVATAVEVARAKSGVCGRCSHFDRSKWLKACRLADGGDRDVGDVVNQVRAAILHHVGEDEDDEDGGVEATLHSMGWCHALSEHFSDQFVVFPEAGCPGNVCSEDRPNGFFKARDSEAKAAGRRARDEILMRAAGKKLT